jgi:hypothetical protein
MPERGRQDQKLVPFVAKAVEKVSKVLPRLLQGRQPTKPQILALSKYMQASPGAYKLTVAMDQDRAAWNALSPEEQELSDEQHDYDNHRRTTLTWLCTQSTPHGTLWTSPNSRAVVPSAAASSPRRS